MPVRKKHVVPIWTTSSFFKWSKMYFCWDLLKRWLLKYDLFIKLVTLSINVKFYCHFIAKKNVEIWGVSISKSLLRWRPRLQVISHTAKINTLLYFNPHCSLKVSQKSLSAVAAAGSRTKCVFLPKFFLWLTLPNLTINTSFSQTCGCGGDQTRAKFKFQPCGHNSAKNCRGWDVFTSK